MRKSLFSFPFQFVLLALLAFSLESCAQSKQDRPSPPMVAEGKINGVSVKVDYSSPAVKERKVWGDLVAMNEVWRAGANEATIVETSGDLTVGGNTLPAGKYALFAIPKDGSWTWIFNSEWDQWGAYNYSEEKDVLRVDVPVAMNGEHMERLTYKVNEASGTLDFMWEKAVASIPLK